MRTRFRSHHTLPNIPAEAATLVALAAEWVTLNESANTAAALRRWGRIEPALADFEYPCDIVDAIDEDHPAEKDARMLALLRLAQTGRHTLAGRILLQQMLPKLADMAFRLRCRDYATRTLADRHDLVIGEFWTVVMGYDCQRRPTKVAANLALDTLHRCVVTHNVETTELPRDEITHYPAARYVPANSSSGLATLLEWANKHGYLPDADLELLDAVYLRDSATEIAATLQLTPAALRQRCHRAAKRLAQQLQRDDVLQDARDLAMVAA